MNLKIDNLYGLSANLRVDNLLQSHTKNRSVAGIWGPVFLLLMYQVNDFEIPNQYGLSNLRDLENRSNIQ